METSITVKYADDTTGFADLYEIEKGTTVGDFLDANAGENFDSSKYSIRVNSDIVTGDYILNDNDSVICYPKSTKGA